MYTVVRNRGDDLWTVGYYAPSDEGPKAWYAIEDFSNRKAAFAFINYLNGGIGDLFVEPNVYPSATRRALRSIKEDDL